MNHVKTLFVNKIGMRPLVCYILCISTSGCILDTYGGETTTSGDIIEVNIWLMTIGLSSTKVKVHVVPSVNLLGCSPGFGALFRGEVNFLQDESSRKFFYHSSEAYMLKTHNHFMHEKQTHE